MEAKVKKPIYKHPIFIILCSILAIIMILNIWFVVVGVSGDSMNPTLESGSIHIALRHFDIERGDIVSIASDKLKVFLIKRVIGLPNETIEFKNNQLYVNNQLIEDYGVGTTEDLIITLNEDQYFCLGDNREHSGDSRQYGAFTRDEIFACIIN